MASLVRGIYYEVDTTSHEWLRIFLNLDYIVHIRIYDFHLPYTNHIPFFCSFYLKNKRSLFYVFLILILHLIQFDNETPQDQPIDSKRQNVYMCCMLENHV